MASFEDVIYPNLYAAKAVHTCTYTSAGRWHNYILLCTVVRVSYVVTFLPRINYGFRDMEVLHYMYVCMYGVQGACTSVLTHLRCKSTL